MKSDGPLVQVHDLRVHFPIRAGLFSRPVAWIKAVDGIDLDIAAGETLGLVGESGCGKSTLGRAILKLEAPKSGTVWFEGRDIVSLTKAELRDVRRRMRLVFQDPYSSLNPRMTVSDIVGESFDIHRTARGEERDAQVRELLKIVGLQPDDGSRYPHQFSGGQRQRIGIARALALQPSLIVCDEPVSALDVSIQSQVLNLLAELQERFNLSYLFISHDLKVVEFISHRVAVMYLGRIFEIASKQDLYATPLHPYTEALMSASPVPDPKTKRNRIILEGEVPNPIDPPSGCTFHPRCIHADDRCRSKEPELQEFAPNHLARCWKALEISKIP